MTERGWVPPPASDVYPQMAVMLTSHWVSPTVRIAADLSLAEQSPGVRRFVTDHIAAGLVRAIHG
jgi:hypothetical protein